LLDDADWKRELATWASSLPSPRAILMLSAHWVDAPPTLGATRMVPLVYDFYGFPDRFYQLKYPAPGAPELASRVRTLLAAIGGSTDSERGLDHGAYVPLVAMYPNADVPVLQLSLPSLDAHALHRMGAALAPLRDEGVLIVGSGFLTHNMRALDMAPRPTTPAWASEFDVWAKEALEKKDVDSLLGYQARAPGVTMALPTVEHFVPVLVSQGAAGDRDAVRFPITGFAHGSFTRRSVQWG
jgi:4,5-DOPA dioxygenase extradiol